LFDIFGIFDRNSKIIDRKSKIFDRTLHIILIIIMVNICLQQPVPVDKAIKPII
jgi:hypothetical protein